jgi:hypothetical protein
MIATNSVAPISGSLRAQVQKLRADALSKQEFESLDPDVIASLIDLLDQAENVLVVLADEEEQVQANADLSDAGRTKTMVKAVRAAHGKLRQIHRKGIERRQAYESESAAIYSAPKPASDALTASLREMELRDKLRAAPLHEQMRAYLIAAERGWRDTLRALKDVELFGENPSLIAYIARVDRERFEAKEPKQASRLKALKYSAELLHALWAGIDFRMSGYAEIPVLEGKTTGHMDLAFVDITAPPEQISTVDPPPAGVSSFQ